MPSQSMSVTNAVRRQQKGAIVPLRAALLICVLTWCAGCHRIRVNVETHLIADAARQTRLDSPRFAIAARSEEAASSLAYQEVADVFGEAIKLVRPQMKRAATRDADDVLSLTMDFHVVDRGTGIAERPVRGYVGAGYGCGPCYGWHDHYGYVGTTYEPVHLGYGHTMSVSAWVPDDSQPGGRRVLWEGQADLTTSERSPKVTMPYLAVALTSFYGQATAGSVRVKFKPDDERVATVGRLARHSK